MFTLVLMRDALFEYIASVKRRVGRSPTIIKNDFTLPFDLESLAFVLACLLQSMKRDSDYLLMFYIVQPSLIAAGLLFNP